MDMNEKLLESVSNENIKQVKKYLEQGANVNYISPLGDSPLREATEKNNLELVKFLVSKGADVNLHDSSDFSPLMITTAHKESYDIAKYLIEQGANVNCQTYSGRTALIRAAQNNQDPKKIIATLLEHGANVNAKDKNGNTALIYTIKRAVYLPIQERLDTAKLLIANGADLNVKNNNNETALTIAQKSNNKELITLLKAHELLEKAIYKSKRKTKLQTKAKSNDFERGI